MNEGMHEIPVALTRAARERIRELERELQDALVVTAAIIRKYGDEGRRVTLSEADLEQVRREPPTMTRLERSPNFASDAFTLEIRP